MLKAKITVYSGNHVIYHPNWENSESKMGGLLVISSAKQEKKTLIFYFDLSLYKLPPIRCNQLKEAVMDGP